MFRMFYMYLQFKNPTHTVSTQAYAIEVLHKVSVQMLQIRKILFNLTLAFVPYPLRHKLPEGYEKAIRYQTQPLTMSMVVILQNISTDMMFCLQHWTSSWSAQSTTSTFSKNTSDSGRYSVVVDEMAIDKNQRSPLMALPKWLQTDVPSDAMPPLHLFTGPARVKQLYDDGLSSE